MLSFFCFISIFFLVQRDGTGFDVLGRADVSLAAFQDVFQAGSAIDRRSKATRPRRRKRTMPVSEDIVSPSRLFLWIGFLTIVSVFLLFFVFYGQQLILAVPESAPSSWRSSRSCWSSPPSRCRYVSVSRWVSSSSSISRFRQRRRRRRRRAKHEKKTKLVLSLRQTCRRREKRLLQIEFETGFGSHWNRLMDVLARLVSESRWLVAIFGRAKEGPSFSWDFRPRSSLILCLVLAFVCLCAPNHYHDRGVVLFESNKRISARSSGPSRGGRGGSQCAVRWLAERRRHWITRALSVKRVCSKHNDIWNWVVVFSQHLRTGRLLIQSFHGNETRLDPFPFRLSFDGSVATRWRWSRHSRWWKKTTFSPPLPQWCTSTLKRHISWCT